MDLTETIVPKSDQLNAEDLLTGPRTFTVADVKKGSAEQPVDIYLVEFPRRPFRPSKTVRRILVNAWGPDAAAYVGRRMTLYRDPTVKFGGMDVGGIRVSHLSHIDRPLSVALTVSRGRRAPYTVQPLADTPQTDPGPAQRPALEATGGGGDSQPDAPGPGSDQVTSAQLKKIGAQMRDLGLTDRAVALGFVADVIGREVSSRNELTRGEASRLIERMAYDLGELPEPEGEQS